MYNYIFDTFDVDGWMRRIRPLIRVCMYGPPPDLASANRKNRKISPINPTAILVLYIGEVGSVILQGPTVSPTGINMQWLSPHIQYAGYFNMDTCRHSW